MRSGQRAVVRTLAFTLGEPGTWEGEQRDRHGLTPSACEGRIITETIYRNRRECVLHNDYGPLYPGLTH